MRSRRAWLAVLAVCACAKGTPSVPPELTSVTPPIVFAAEEPVVTLRGDAFSPKVSSRWGARNDDVAVSADFEVFAGPHALAQVTWVDVTTLTVVVPAAVPAGTYAVKVVDPYGASVSLPNALEVRGRRGGQLTATLSPAASAIRIGQEIAVFLDVTNGGDTAVEALGPRLLPATGTAEVTAIGASGGQTALAPGGSTRFTLRWVGTRVGEVHFFAEVRGIDAASGLAVRAGPLSAAPVQIVAPPQLTATLTAAQPAVAVGGQIDLVLSVTNVGFGAVRAFMPEVTALTPGRVDPKAVPLARDIGPGATQTFAFAFDAIGAGDVTLRADGVGTDPSSGTLVAIPFALAEVTILPLPDAGVPDAGVPDAGAPDAGDAGIPDAGMPDAGTPDAGVDPLPIATDPFGDGTAFAHVFSYAGKVWLGPRANGTGAVSMNPDGTGATAHTFAFARDTGGGATHANTSAAPYPSIGAAGCTNNTPTCGPNNENGRGLFFSTNHFGTELLGVTGAHLNNKLEYAYVTADTDAVLDFRFLDLSAALGGTARTVSAAWAFNNRLYLGVPDTGGARPYLVALRSAVPAGGLNATAATMGTPDLLDLRADLFPGLGKNGGNNTPTALVDALIDFGDALYAANNGGLIRSTTNAPFALSVNAGDWATATPSDPAYAAKASATVVLPTALEPKDRAFPGFAAFNGHLYAARNTTTGPQLWACTPGADLACQPAEWALVAGVAQLTQLDDPANAAIGFLAATPGALFVGFDNPNGVQVFKTTAAAPAVRADFTQVGTPGFGSPADNTRLFDGEALTFGPAVWLYLVTGNGTNGVRVWRIPG